MNSGWSDGDWNADKEFDTCDFVAAFTDGGYEEGPRGVAFVLEPNTFIVVVAALLFSPFVLRQNR